MSADRDVIGRVGQHPPGLLARHQPVQKRGIPRGYDRGRQVVYPRAQFSRPQDLKGGSVLRARWIIHRLRVPMKKSSVVSSKTNTVLRREHHGVEAIHRPENRYGESEKDEVK